MQDNQNELIWLAFRYIANEMDSAERESFDARLLDDQSAREAVAQAVDLSRAVAMAAPAVLPIHRSAYRRRAVPWLVAAAAGIVAAAVLHHAFQPSADVSRLANFWAKHLGQDSVVAGELFAGSEEPVATEEVDDLAVPSWMIEAVSGASDSDKWEDS